MQAKQEREKLYETIMSGKLTDSAISFFNERFNSVEKEITTLSSRVEFLRTQCMSDTDIFNFVEKNIDSLEYFADILCKAPDNPDAQRAIILAHVEKIQELENGEFLFKFTFSSEKRTEWGSTSNFTQKALWVRFTTQDINNQHSTVLSNFSA